MLARIWTAFLLSLAGVSAIAWLVALMREKDIRPVREMVVFFKKRSKAGRVVFGALFIGFLVIASVKPGDGGGNGGGGDGGGTNNLEMVVGPGGGLLPGNTQGSATNNAQSGLQGGILPGGGTGETGVPPVESGNPASVPDEWADFPPIISTNTMRTLTGDDFRRGFVLARVGTGEQFDFSAPPDAVVCSDWRAFGAATDWIYVAFTNWAFQVGTNEIDRLRIYAFGKVEPQVIETGDSIATNYWFAPFMSSLGIVPEANWDGLAESDRPSQLWHCVTPSNTLQVTWQNALLGRDTDTPLSFQIEFKDDGQFIFRYDLSRCGGRGATALPDGVITNLLSGASFAGNSWATNSLPTNVTSMTFCPLAAEDAYNPDSDGDGLPTIDELFVYHTDPHNADTDYDGFTDYEELFVHGTGPLNPHSVSDVYSDGFALKIGGENPFACPEGSTNTVLEHVFYSGTTNGAFAYPQSSDDTAVLRVSVSGSGTGDLVVGGQVVPLVAQPPLRGDPPPHVPLLVRVVKGETYRLFYRGNPELNVSLSSDDFAFGSLPTWSAYGHVNFPNTVATQPCIHDFNARMRGVSLPTGRDADELTATWQGSMDVVVSNIPPRSATVSGYFNARGTSGITYELDHPQYLFGEKVYAQTVRFCPRPADPDPSDPPEPGDSDPDWYDAGDGDPSDLNDPGHDERWCCFWGSCDGSCGCGDAACCGGGGDAPGDFDDDCPVHHVPYAQCAPQHASDYTNGLVNVEHLGGVLYIRDPPVYEQIDLAVPSGHVNCCPCPDHSTNYVGVAYKSYRLRLVDANGLPFRSSGESCTVNLAGVRPSAAARDATLALVRNGEVYRQYDKTVLGVSVRGGAVDLETCNALNANFGYPMAVCTNLADPASPDMKLVTDVKLLGGHVHLELSDATAPFAVWYYDRRNGVYRKLLDTSSTPVKDLSMAYWKVLMKRAVDGNSNEMPIYVTSPAPGSVKLRFRYWNVIDGRFVQDEAVQAITSVKPPLLVDYNRDGKIDADDIQAYVGGRLAYFWMNDDTWRYDDAFDTSWVGLLGSLGLQDIRNSSNGTVDGRCDLINFLPVAVDVGAFATNWNPNAVYYRLEAGNGGLQSSKIAFADVDWARIGETPFGTDCDIHGNDLHEAPVSALGVWTNLPSAFVSRTLSGSSTLLMEFPSAARYAPLRLKVYSKADDALLFSSSITLHVGDVSQMVGWLNLRSAAGRSGGVPTRLTTMDWPTEAHEPGNVVFVHGYNMEEDDETPLWAQNVFKKLWWAGLDRGFMAVQWRGNEGQTPLELPELGYVTPNYYGNVQNAFATASAFKTAMDGVSGPKWFVAHSLGNMLVSAAIQDYGMQYERFFLLNAAVAMEAFDPTGGITQASHDNMTPQTWTNYTDRVRATHWYNIFPEGDGRRLLTWKGRFSNVTNIVNFYSTQEEVVCNGDGEPKDIGRNYSWYNQEYRKGNWTWMLHCNEGGWAFNRSYGTNTSSYVGGVLTEWWSPLPPTAANELTDTELRQVPFFLDFANAEMHSSSNGLIVSTNYLYRAEMLAYAIPSESYAVGSNPLPGREDVSYEDWDKPRLGSYNMAFLFDIGKGDLPPNGDKPKDKHRDWQHSTFVQRSYKRVHQLFKVMTKFIKEDSNE